MPPVERACKMCDPAAEDITAGWCIVSPFGIAHEGSAWGGKTRCGKDATGPRWWWPC